MKPILFNTEMVRAILEGLKTVTRRAVKPQPLEGVREMYQSTSRGRTVWRSPGEHVWCEVPAPFHPGDTLWVRETWAKSMSGTFMYKADGKAILVERWHPSIHMPREAARIFLRVTDVRVARLQDCGNMQAKDEGCVSCSQFARVWDSTIKPADRPTYGWEANPWVWVIEFERISKDEANHDD